MDIGSIIGGITGSIGDIIGVVSNPVDAVKYAGMGAAAIFLGIPLLDVVCKVIDDGILWVDDMVIDRVPIKSVKDFLQNKMIDRLKKRIKRYEELIEKVSD